MDPDGSDGFDECLRRFWGVGGSLIDNIPGRFFGMLSADELNGPLFRELAPRLTMAYLVKESQSLACA